MAKLSPRWTGFLGGLIVAAALWATLGDRVVTHMAYALERGRLQAGAEELAELQAERPEVYGLARAFKLVGKVARPGVVHIAVSGGEGTRYSDEEIDEYLHQHLKELIPEDEPNEDHEAAPPGADDSGPPKSERGQDKRETLRRWLRALPTPPGSGSGIIFDPAGYILTNNHVVNGRDEFRVVLYDDRVFAGKLIGTDPKTDLAVLKIDAPDLHPLAFGNSDRLDVGDWVLAVGSPFGLQQTVTHGIVSAKGRTRVPGIDIDYQDFIQTDAAINPGNSGGPLLNLHGEVVGVNTAIATHGDGVNAGIAFTIPSNRAARIAQQLRTNGSVTRGWLGISFLELELADVEIFGLHDDHGVFVERVLADSPAQHAGLQVEDVLIEVNGVSVSGSEQLRGLIADLLPEEAVPVRVIRDRQELALTVRLGVQPANLLEARRTPATEAREVKRLGMEVRTFRPALPRVWRLAYKDNVRGALVWRIDPESKNTPAVQASELIVGCNGRPVTSVLDLVAALEAVPTGKPVELEILEPVGDRRIVHVNPATK
jgi:serine protease Do